MSLQIKSHEQQQQQQQRGRFLKRSNFTWNFDYFLQRQNNLQIP